MAPPGSPPPIGAGVGVPDATGGVPLAGLDPSTAIPDAGTGAPGGADPNQSLWDRLVGGATNSITKNPLGIAVAGGALAYDVLKGNPDSSSINALKAEAPGLAAQGAALTASGQNLQTYLTNGTLPPGLQQQVTNAVQAAKARIIANHAANGENTNPAQNSALAQELNQVDLDAIAQAGTLETQLFQSGTQLLQTGINETGLSSQIYEALVKIDQTNNNQLMTAIASMAAALGGGTKIQIGGGGTGVTVG